MKRTLFVLVLAPLLAGLAEAQNCPISGIATTDVGQGTGFLLPSHLNLSWDSSTCSLQVQVDAASCCNTYAIQHFVLFGDGLLPAPIPLNGAFLTGSDLLVRPQYLFGPFSGLSSTHPVPPDPALVGLTFAAQAAPVYFTTIGFTRDLAVTQAVVFTFQ